MPLSRKELNILWGDLQKAIDAEVLTDSSVLSTYSECHDYQALNILLAAECDAEKRHRAMRHRAMIGGQYTQPVTDAAMSVIMRNIRFGALLREAPLASTFLSLRASAAEAQTIGYELRSFLSKEWLVEAGHGRQG